MKVIPVILCGGAGTRLWPLSRELYPKQLLALVDEHSLLQNTVIRCDSYADVTSPVLVCNEEHRFLVAEQLREVEIVPSSIILEPEGRNTAPAVALAAHEILKQEDDAILVVLPSDHVIEQTDVFLDALTRAIEFAKSDALVTFGVVPDKPETGYGYIKKGLVVEEAYRVDRFVEKPDLKSAQSYLEQGNYLWNSGMFIFKALTLVDELITHSPEIVASVNDAVNKYFALSAKEPD